MNVNSNATHSCIVYLESTQLFDVGGLTGRWTNACSSFERAYEKDGEIFHFRSIPVNLTVANLNIYYYRRSSKVVLIVCVVGNLIERRFNPIFLRS